MSLRGSVVVLLACGAALAGGFGDADPPGSRDRATTLTATAPDGQPLLPVSLPDLSRMDEAGQRQVEERFVSLTKIAGRRARDAEELGKAFGEMGRLLMAVEYPDAAEPCLRNAHTLVPGDMRWPYYLGHLYKRRSELVQSATFFEKTLAIRPDDPAALLWLGSVYLDQDRPEDAEKQFLRALSLDPRSAPALFGAGRVALAKRDYRSAVDRLEQALALEPGGTAIHYPLAMAYRGVGDVRKADAHLRQRGDVKVDPPDPLMNELEGVLQTAQAFENRGARAIAQGKWDEAAAHFRKATEFAPQSSSMRLNLGTALLRSGDGQGALRQYEEAVRLSPESATAHLSLGLLLEMGGRDPEAIDRFAAATTYAPDLLIARLTFANALRRNGRLEESLAQYERIQIVEPTAADARFGHAIALVRLGRYREARDDLIEALKVVSEQRRFSHALARLLAAAPDDKVRDGRAAMAIVNRLLEGEHSMELAETYAMTLAELGRYGEAAQLQRDAMATAKQWGNRGLSQRLAYNLSRYERGEPCRTPWSDDDPIHAPGPKVEPELFKASTTVPQSR